MMNEMRVGIYARVSTQDKDYNPARASCSRCWSSAGRRGGGGGEFVGYASATDDRRRMSWKRLLSEAAKRRLDVTLDWKVDRVRMPDLGIDEPPSTAPVSAPPPYPKSTLR